VAKVVIVKVMINVNFSILAIWWSKSRLSDLVLWWGGIYECSQCQLFTFSWEQLSVSPSTDRHFLLGMFYRIFNKIWFWRSSPDHYQKLISFSVLRRLQSQTILSKYQQLLVVTLLTDKSTHAHMHKLTQSYSIPGNHPRRRWVDDGDWFLFNWPHFSGNYSSFGQVPKNLFGLLKQNATQTRCPFLLADQQQ